jgi:hypothetical protein
MRSIRRKAAPLPKDVGPSFFESGNSPGMTPEGKGAVMWYVRHRVTLAGPSPEPLIYNFQTALDARAALMVRRHGLAPDSRPVFGSFQANDALQHVR